MPSGGSTTDSMLSMSLYFRMRSLTVVDVSEGDAFTCVQKCQALVSQPAEQGLEVGELCIFIQSN